MKTAQSCRKQGFLQRLRSDISGNIIPLTAAATIPLMGLVGSAVDLSRSYMTRARLQQACDAGVLAGRRAVTTTGFSSDAQARATDIFNANFPAGYQQSTGTTFNPTTTDAGVTIGATASTQLPTTLMRFFGQPTQELQVDCNAKMEVGNSDIAFVLDTTASMACPNNFSANQCATTGSTPWAGFNNYNAAGNWSVTESTVSSGPGTTNTSRMQALRNAVVAFDSVVKAAAATGNPRIRYAFIPFAMTVNAGRLVMNVNSDYVVGGKSNENWTYQSRSGTTRQSMTYGVSAYVATRTSGTVPSPAGTDSITSATSSWAGCLEEPNTVTDSTFNYNGTTRRIEPTAAHDLNIDQVPNGFSDVTRWRPYWPEAVWRTGSERAQHNCPAQASTLAVMSSTQVQTYVNTLVAGGATYHDVGALWAARIMSPTGLWASNVNTAPPNGNYVGRHIIFMTDGQLASGVDEYSTYGLERYDKRLTGSNNIDPDNRHKSRFSALCNAIKAQGTGGTRIWVVLFGTSPSTELSNCASADSVFTATDAASLNNVFIQIAQTISDLRLSQ